MTTLPRLRVSMISLGVKDMTRSVQFYTETLGLSLDGKPGVVTLVRAGAVSIALNEPLGRAADVLPGATEIIFPVDSVADGHDALAERGCNFLAPPHEIYPGMWAATFTDPDGHKLTILGPR
ncbi:MAG TPA: VOC family protein [Bryobacteraceae bacterium]|jgi:catechol 2,3-dioxygenase-like lactoylglutathione lyase family enzyme